VEIYQKQAKKKSSKIALNQSLQWQNHSLGLQINGHSEAVKNGISQLIKSKNLSPHAITTSAASAKGTTFFKDPAS
jgi:hypothetical protein